VVPEARSARGPRLIWADLGIELAERGLLPDAAVRAGIRRLLARQLGIARRDPAATARARAAYEGRMAAAPVAFATGAANRQHYEVPAAFYACMLGRRMKYSSGLWPTGVEDLDAAEEAMLKLTARRAGIEDGMRVLDLGSGWGAFALWAAERWPSARVLAVSNSESQREHVTATAARRRLANLEVRRGDMNTFEPGARFDRVVSVEMFEHLANPGALVRRIAGWLEPGGALFVDVFSHRELAYAYDTDGDETWMARHFFTGGMMPAHDLLPGHAAPLVPVEAWRESGTHYARTLEAWLERLDANRRRAIEALRPVSPGGDAARAFQRWRMFVMACAELFAYAGGTEWGVSHYRFEKR